ncbi:acetyl-CoA carboxylase carboxyltransferase subunit alpha [Floccifex sp.]|uniref:acetyl-CoA carboxylase carboxyltransferase subunit alpha n=1 Tax=Floccifex sp. TaxID=2815810 RepID=UPI003F076A40
MGRKKRECNVTDGLYKEIEEKIEALLKSNMHSLDVWQRITLARASERKKAQDFIPYLFADFIEFHGDRKYGDDGAIIGGIGMFNDQPVTVMAQSKGKNIEENIKKNFGMVNPEGYRKAIRLAKQAEKFHRPIITFVDTAGAYPGKGAEQRGQAQAIADCLYTFSDLKTPIICVVLSEGGSGGALALSVADRIVMLENAVYSILSPEGFASILWKDESRAKEASQVMKMTSFDLYQKGIIDHIVFEDEKGMQESFSSTLDALYLYIDKELKSLKKMKTDQLVKKRYEKFRKMGVPVWKM